MVAEEDPRHHAPGQGIAVALSIQYRGQARRKNPDAWVVATNACIIWRYLRGAAQGSICAIYAILKDARVHLQRIGVELRLPHLATEPLHEPIELLGLWRSDLLWAIRRSPLQFLQRIRKILIT